MTEENTKTEETANRPAIEIVRSIVNEERARLEKHEARGGVEVHVSVHTYRTLLKLADVTVCAYERRAAAVNEGDDS